MAVLIDIDMPDKCDNCHLCDIQYTQDDNPTSWLFCDAAQKMIIISHSGSDIPVATEALKKPEWCPLKEVVTCGECKRWYSCADTGMACEFTNLSQPEDGYCNWGEKKE